MPNTRQCQICKAPTLKPVSRQMQIYNSVIHYKCSKCSAEVELIPLASAGVQFVVGLLALGFWGMILFTGSGQPTTFSLIVYFGASLLLLKMTVEQILKHRQFPVLHGSNSQPSLKFTANPHIAKRAILWIENRGFIAGLFAPLILVAVVLGTATLIGYINFTYFE